MKNSFSILELILTLIISSTIIIFSSNYIKDISLLNKELQIEEKTKIDLRSTKIFIEKNLENIDKLQQINNILYFDNEILLDKIEEFKISKNRFNIEIFIRYSDKIAQKWVFAL